MSQEINKACEFSCDEVIISKSDFNGAQEYGKILLDAMAKAGNYYEVVCIDQISLDKNISYQCDINAEKGIGLFVGLSTSSDITSIGGRLFYEAYGHNGSGNMINATFSDSKPVTYYVYVGNANRQTNSKIENITGSLILILF